MPNDFQTKLMSEWGFTDWPSNLEIQSGLVSVCKWKLLLFGNQKQKIYFTLKGRLVQFSNGSSVLVKKKQDQWNFLINGKCMKESLELGKLAYLSILGINHEVKGELRIHGALFGRKGSHQSTLVLGLPGAGKSTLAQLSLNHNNRAVYTDELAYFDGQKLWGEPLHIINKVDLKKFPVQKDQNKTILRNFILLSAPNNQNRFSYRKASLLTRLKILFFLVSGYGLHQMAIFHLSLINLNLWTKIFFNRVRLSLALLKGARIYQLSLKKELK
jgi:hypothetical protein